MWRDIIGFEGKYQINEYGVVKSVDRVTKCKKYSRHVGQKILTPVNTGKGYLSVCLRDGVNTYRKYIHRMVAECFVPKASLLYNCVNHIDGNKKNNSYLNLEWCSYSQNNTHAYQYGFKRRGSDFYNSKLSESAVKEILHNGKNDTYQNIARKYGVSKATIRDVLTRKTWKHIS